MAFPRAAFWILLALWALCMGQSILAVMAEPTGDSFLRGMNRVSGFLGWQLGAAIIALVLWLGVRPLPRGEPLRRLGRVPGWWAVALLALLLAWIAVGVIGSEMDRRAIPAEPPGPVTVPVD